MNYVLYNPFSGTGTAMEQAKALKCENKSETIYKDISKIDDYKSFISELKEDDVIVICGGDGTLNRFVNDTEGLYIPCDILYLATGTGNDFLNDIEKKKEDCPISVKKYLEDLPSVTVKGKSYRFINNVGFGIDGYCCEVGDELKSKSGKPVNYTAIAIKGLLFKYKPKSATVIVDGKQYDYKKVWIAPTMKGRFYGGGMMATPKQNRCSDNGGNGMVIGLVDLDVGNVETVDHTAAAGSGFKRKCLHHNVLHVDVMDVNIFGTA